MAVKITTDAAGSFDNYPDEGRGKPAYRYRIVAGGAVQVISTPPDSVGLAGSTVEITYGPTGYTRAEGTMFAGTDQDVDLA